jgi:hypothetical protein
MQFEIVSFILNWILYLSLFVAAFFWLRRAWRIFIKHDYSEVALKRGEAPPNPKRYAPACGLINLVAGVIAVYLIITIPLGVYDFSTWIEYAGLTLWFKIILDFIVSRQAHPFKVGKKKKKIEER